MPEIVSSLRLFAVAALLVPVAAVAATPITGVVTNGTTNKPSAGDEVVLIRLAQGMQESTRTTTDAKGRFTLQVPDEGLHLVRVTHDKANYFRPAPAGTQSVELEVYNSAEHVKGVSTEAAVMKLQTDPGGTNLKVVENFFVKNDSKPPMTQFSKQPFDFYLPEGAVLEGSAALAPGGMPVQATPVPLGDKGHYTFLFPLRPGETRFQVSYHVPYSGRYSFDRRIAGPTGTLAIIMPKSITFTPANGAPYNPVEEEPGAQTYVARDATPAQPLSFTLAGKGELPRDNANEGAGGQAGAPTQGAGQAGSQTGDVAATDRTSPGKGLDNPLDPEGTRDPWGKYKWWILAGMALLLAIAAGVMLRKPTGAALPLADAAPATPPPPAHTRSGSVLDALKEELFSLETERLQGSLSESDYQQQKAALETVLKRALSRPGPNAS